MMTETDRKKAAREILRNYLIRCHSDISTEYEEFQSLPPEEAADYLLHLRDSGRIESVDVLIRYYLT